MLGAEQSCKKCRHPLPTTSSAVCDNDNIDSSSIMTCDGGRCAVQSVEAVKDWTSEIHRLMNKYSANRTAVATDYR